MFTKQRTLRLISRITLMAFVYTFVVCEPLLASFDNSRSNGLNKELCRQLEAFKVPSRYGRIAEGKYKTNDHLIIHIQDLHCHKEIQKNISNLIKVFNDLVSISRIYIEGAPSGKVDASMLSELPEKDIQANVLNSLLETGLISGAEYYAVMHDKENMLYGIEDWDKYIDNLARINNLIKIRQKNELIVKVLDGKINEIRDIYLSSELKNLEERLYDPLLKEKKTEEYYIYLKKLADKTGENINLYPNLAGYIQIINIRNKIKYRKLSVELKQYQNELKKVLPYQVYSSLATKLSNGNSIDRYAHDLYAIAKEYTPDLYVKYPNVSMFLKYAYMNSILNPVLLLEEEKVFKDQILIKSADTLIDKEMLFLAKMGRSLRNMVKFEISSDEYKYFNENRNRYASILSKYLDNSIAAAIKDSKEWLNATLHLLKDKELQEYYSANLRRNDVFVKNIFDKKPSISKIESIGGSESLLDNINSFKKIDIVVTGGFHNEIYTSFDKLGVSYLSIIPNVSESVDQYLYEDILLGNLDISAYLNSSLIPLRPWLADPTNKAELLDAYENNFNSFISIIVFHAADSGFSNQKISDMIKTLKHKFSHDERFLDINIEIDKDSSELYVKKLGNTIVTVTKDSKVKFSEVPKLISRISKKTRSIRSRIFNGIISILVVVLSVTSCASLAKMARDALDSRVRRSLVASEDISHVPVKEKVDGTLDKARIDENRDIAGSLIIEGLPAFKRLVNILKENKEYNITPLWKQLRNISDREIMSPIMNEIASYIVKDLTKLPLVVQKNILQLLVGSTERLRWFNNDVSSKILKPELLKLLDSNDSDVRDMALRSLYDTVRHNDNEEHEFKEIISIFSVRSAGLVNGAFYPSHVFDVFSNTRFISDTQDMDFKTKYAHAKSVLRNLYRIKAKVNDVNVSKISSFLKERNKGLEKIVALDSNTHLILASHEDDYRNNETKDILEYAKSFNIKSYEKKLMEEIGRAVV